MVLQQEEALILQAQKGDQQAFGELVLTYRKNVFGLAYRMSGNAADAEDLSQETFLKAFLALPDFVSQRNGSFKAWLLTITYRLSIDRARRQKYHDSYEEILPGQELQFSERYSESLPEIVARQETKSLVQKALLQLPEKYRMAVILKYLEDLGYEEISKIMNIPLGTVGTWIRRSLKRLKNDLLLKGAMPHEE